LGTSQSPSRLKWGLPHREKPRFLHVFVGLAVLVLSYALLWLNFRDVLSDAVIQVLSVGQISVGKSLPPYAPQLVIKLLDGSTLDLALTWQRSGLVSITIFGLLFLFLMFPLDSSFWLKLVWLELGFIIGLIWVLIRLLVTVLVAYHFGVGAFMLAEFFTGPLIDFFWVISVWSLGLSALIAAKRKQVS